MTPAWLDASVCLTGAELVRLVVYAVAVGAPAVLAVMVLRWRR